MIKDSEGIILGQEEKAYATEGIHRLLLDESPDPIFAFAPDGEYLYVNRAFSEGVRRRLDQIIHRKIWDVFPKEEAEKRFAAPRAVFKSGIKKVIEGRVPRTDREQYYVTTITPIKDADGRVGTVICSSKDITERRLAELALRESEARNSAFMEFLPAMVMIKDHESRPLFANTCYRKRFPFDEWQGKKPHECFPHAVANQMVAMDEMALKHGFNTYEESWMGADGILCHYRTTKFRIDLPGASPLLGTIIIDITDQKRAEEEREQLQGLLLHAQKMESVGRLAGGVAHDFNNMLQAILGYAELALGETTPGQKIHGNLEQIQKTAKRSADLTRQLLAFARKQPMSPRDLDLNETISGTLSMLQRLIGEDIQLAWVPGANLARVKMDPSQVDQVLANLCVNARDAIEGVGRITIETSNATIDEATSLLHPECSCGEYVMLALSDTGCGMQEGVLQHLFEPFFTTKAIGHGTGLGLATVYGIVKQNDGFIKVFSEPGKGTTFKIYFPQKDSTSVLECRDLEESSPTRGHELLLVVEDELLILEMSRTMLEELGYRVLTTSNPWEALQLAAQHAGEIHLLVTDVILPEMNGRELSERLLSQYPTMKCLYMSGYTADIIANQGRLEEGVRFLQKPFSLRDLATRVREVLDEDSGR